MLQLDMRLDNRHEYSIAIIGAAGDLDAMSADELREVIRVITKHGIRDFIIDAEHLHFVDSFGFAVLEGCRRYTADRGGNFVLASLPPRTRLAFEMADEVEKLAICPSIDDAIAEINGAASN